MHLIFCFIGLAAAWPRIYDENTTDESNSTVAVTEAQKPSTTTGLTTNRVPDFFEQKSPPDNISKLQVNEMAGVSCEVCLKAVYGINYNVIRLKKAAEDMVKQDCEALFHGNGEYIARCIRVMVEKIEHYYDKVEPMIDTRNLCVKMRMCAPKKATKNE